MKNGILGKKIIPIICVLLVIVIVFCVCTVNNNYSKSSFLMGTSVSVNYNGKDDLTDEMIIAIANIDNLISTTKAESEISILNKKGSLEVSNETLSLINRSIELSKMSDGAFDITTGVLTDLWDFNGGNKTVPPQSEINNALKTVGYQNIKIDGNKITLLNGTQLDLGSVGKGVGCDEAISTVLDKGNQAVVTVGGSVGVEGKSATIGIRDPLGDANSYFATIDVENAFVSTSGNYEKFFEVGSVRYCHIFDLSTGYSVQNNLISVTVVCDSGFMSDALSTTIYAMGDTNSAETLLNYYNAMAVFVFSDKTVKTVNSKCELKITGDGYEEK